MKKTRQEKGNDIGEQEESNKSSAPLKSPEGGFRALARFKQPRYIIPLILLPFIFLFYFIFNNWSRAKTTAEVKTDSIPSNQINPNMPGVSAEVNEARIKDKFGAYLEAYQHNKDASALDNIDNNAVLQGNDFTSAYSLDDLRRLQQNRKTDSLKNVLTNGQKDIDRQMAQIYANTNRRSSSASGQQGDAKTVEALMSGFTYNADKAKNGEKAETDPYQQQMQLFRDQMTIVDSMQQSYTGQTSASDKHPESGEAGRKRKTLTNNFEKNRFDPEKDSSFQPLKVSRTSQQGNVFNTVSGSKPAEEIKAMIDQDLKAIAGSRVRIRLLTDIFVGEQLIPKGTFLFGMVSGFQTQRINISINQVVNDNTALPVKLDVYDNDGYLGLYVPGSSFREFTKEIGTQGTQGLSQVRTSDNSNVTTGLVSQVFQSASTSVSKLIQKEKAFLKYNYIVYLRSRN